MRITCCYCLLLCIPFFSYSQNCFNANFEQGTFEGFTAYSGSISEEGNVFINRQGIVPYRHELVKVIQGFDTIALRYCELNKYLPLVPKDGGQYTLRLGNPIAGAEAELIVLQFEVTPELTFFQLRYAVVLNDPEHEPHEQPRFELRILDENNNVIPCGEYKVRAAKEIPDFESCRAGWRVRPWTTVGFDLQAHVGKTIQIEFLTTDCAKGAHAGYAYLEASCQPLSIELKPFCTGTEMTTAEVTQGFAEYLWNTGDTNAAITIPNPQVDSAYSVTITSATGCSFVMSDTVAHTPRPIFDSESNLKFCRDTQYWFTPKGRHLDSIYCPTLALTGDSFLIGTNLLAHTFIAPNRNGCFSDTLQFRLSKGPLAITAAVDALSCFGDQNGSIQVAAETDFLPFNYQWTTGGRSATLNNLSAGTYALTLSDAIQCTSTATFHIQSPPALTVKTLDLQPITCNGMENGQLTIDAKGGVPPYQFDWNAVSRNTTNLENLGPGEYEVTVTDEHGCTDKNSMLLEEPSPIMLQTTSTEVSCFGGEDGTIAVDITGGVLPYTIFWEDDLQEDRPVRSQLKEGLYQVAIEDMRGCTAEAAIAIDQPYFKKACGIYIPSAFSPNGDGRNDLFYVESRLPSLSLTRMQIFNRWGVLVFENSQDCKVVGTERCGWSGQMNNTPAPAGVYVYLIVIEVEGYPEPVIYKGDVSLVR